MPDHLSATARRSARLFADRIPRGEFVRGSAIIAAGTGLAQLIAIASAPILTRIYDPREYGVYAVAAAIISIAAVVAGLGYDQAIPLPRGRIGAAVIVVLSTLLVVAVSAAFLVLLILFGDVLLEAAGAAELASVSFLLAAGLLGTGLMQTFVGMATRTKDFRAIATYRLTRSGSMVTMQIVLGLAGAGTVGLIVGAVLSPFLALIRPVVIRAQRDGATYRRVRRSRILAAARRYRRFPLLTAPASLINTSGLALPLLMVVTLFGPEVGGQFALAATVMAAPLTLLSQAIAGPYFAEAAEIVRDRPQDLRHLYVRTTRTVALLILPPIALIAILAPFLFGIVFGEAWTLAGVFAMIRAPSYYAQFVTNPTHATLNVLERQDLHLSREIVRMALLAIVYVVAIAFGLPATETVALITAAGVTTYSWYGLTTWRAIRVHHAAGLVTSSKSRRRRSSEPSSDRD